MTLIEKLPGFYELGLSIKEHCLNQMAKSYSNHTYRIGKDSKDNMAFVQIELDEFQNDILNLYQRNAKSGCIYELVIEIRREELGNIILKIDHDEIKDFLPKGLIKELDEAFYNALME